MRWSWGRRLAPFLALALLLLLARQLWAHANLLQAEPAPNSAHEVAPERVILRFSEPLEPRGSSIELLDATGEPIDTAGAQVDPTEPTIMRLRLPPLGDGVYTVAWKALSIVDGHVTRGVFPFVVGEAPAGPLPTLDSGPEPGSFGEARPLDVLARALALIGSALLVGGFLLHLLLWRPLRGELALPEGAGDARLRQLVHLALGLLALSLLLSLIVQVAELESLATLFPFLLGSPLGYGLIGRLVVLLLLVLVSRELERGRASDLWAGLLFSSILLLITSALSHSATTRVGLWTALLNDALHLLAATLWVGGLVHFLFLMLPALSRLPGGERGPALAALVRRFSPIGFLSVLVLALTGTLSSLLHVGSWEGLWATAYGQTLLVKLLLTLPLLALAAFHLLYVGRRAEWEAKVAARFRHTLRAETLLGLAILAVVGLLTALGPARTALEARQAQRLTVRQAVGSLQATLQITPPLPGSNRFEIYLEDETGQPYDAARRVRLQFTPPDSGLGISEVEAEPLGEGHYVAEGAFLSIVGPWQLSLQVQRPDAYDAFGRFLLLVESDQIRPIYLTSGQVDWGRWLLGGLVLAGVAGLLGALWLWRQPAQRGGAPLFLALGLLLLLTGTLHYRDPFLQEDSFTIEVNPVDPTPDSIARGEVLYGQYCQSCHGVEGDGQGPQAAFLSPPPADLQLHAPLHLDGEIYQWISNGIPGTAMPALEEQIESEDRWHLINYLRVLTAP